MSTTLSDKQVLVVGVGGLGCPASLALARAGVGALTLVDPDVVDPTNLHRQLWHREEDLGRRKVDSAAEKLSKAFPRLSVRIHADRVTAQNANGLFADHDLVIDGTDGVEVKFMLSDVAVRERVPLVYGGVLRMKAQAMLIRDDGPCLRCLFESPPGADDAPSCAQAGVLGSMAGVAGALQAALACAHLEGRGEAKGEATLHVLDGASLVGRAVRVRKAADCAACGAPLREASCPS